MPVLVVGKAAFIAITTIESKTNFVSVLIEKMQNYSRPIFKVIIISLACVRCIRQGKEATCTHKNGDLPPWHSEERHNEIAVIMSNSMDTYLSEVKGVLTDGKIEPVYDVNTLRSMKSPENIAKTINYTEFVYISVDNNAGGKGSDFVIVTSYYDCLKDITVVNFLFFFYCSSTSEASCCCSCSLLIVDNIYALHKLKKGVINFSSLSSPIGLKAKSMSRKNTPLRAIVCIALSLANNGITINFNVFRSVDVCN